MVRFIGFLVGLVFAGVLLISLISGISQLFQQPARAARVRRVPQGAQGAEARQRRPVRQVRQPPGAARLPGLLGSLLGLPQPEAGLVPRPEGDWLQRGRDQEDRIRLEDARSRRSIRTLARPTTRKAIPSDNFPPPFANETAARAANNNALPPDLSLITKAREGGAAYVYSLLTGFTERAGRELLKKFPEAKTPPNLHFNPYFANLNIAMPPPLTTDGQVQYQDGTTGDRRPDGQGRRGVPGLDCGAEPQRAARGGHPRGASSCCLATIFGYLAYQQIWHDAKRAGAGDGAARAEEPGEKPQAKAKQGVAG